jgi:hypothetical protein
VCATNANRWAVHLGAEAVTVLLGSRRAYARSQFDGCAVHSRSAARGSKGTAAHSRSMARAISAAVGGASAASVAMPHTPRFERRPAQPGQRRAACAGVNALLQSSRPARVARRGRFKQGQGAWPPHRTCCVWVSEHSRGNGASHRPHRAVRASSAGWRVAGRSGAVRIWPASPTPASSGRFAARGSFNPQARRGSRR